VRCQTRGAANEWTPAGDVQQQRQLRQAAADGTRMPTEQQDLPRLSTYLGPFRGQHNKLASTDCAEGATIDSMCSDDRR